MTEFLKTRIMEILEILVSQNVGYVKTCDDDIKQAAASIMELFGKEIEKMNSRIVKNGFGLSEEEIEKIVMKIGGHYEVLDIYSFTLNEHIRGCSTVKNLAKTIGEAQKKARA